MTASLADYAAHFAGDPDGFLVGSSIASTRTHGGNVKERGEAEIFLFSMERVENRLDLQDHVNVLAFSNGQVLNNLFEHEGVITANIWREDDDYPVKNFQLNTDSFFPAEPISEIQCKVLRWKQAIYKEQGITDPSLEFEAAQNEAALQFFTSLFSGPGAHDVKHLKKGIEILSQRVQELEAPGEAPLKVGDPVKFTLHDYKHEGKIVELFPYSDRVVVLKSNGEVSVVPYADATKIN